MTPDMVISVLARLEQNGMSCLLFGGWAEEAFGLAIARPHRDIDLLLPARSFSTCDKFLRAGSPEFTEIPLKRFAHKRAFLFDGVMVEIILVQETGQGAVTNFWGDVSFAWKLPLAEQCHLSGHEVRAASRDNLQHFRKHHARTQPGRWKDPASLIASPHFATGD
ncbi:MAG: hypothetical protein U1E67_22185 [Hyphomicrobiales bacterium]